MATDELKKMSTKESLDIGAMFKEGRVPLKVITGEQNNGRVTFLPGAVHVEENATVIFVCG